MSDATGTLHDALTLYERIAGTGSRDLIVLERLTLQPSARVNQLVAQLRRLGLVRTDAGTLELPPLPPDALTPRLDPATIERLRGAQAYWQDWSPPAGDDAGGLHGIRGFWWHWWTVVSTWPRHASLPMDVVMPAAPGYLASSWLEHMDRGMVAEFLGSGWITTRLVVPTGVHDTPLAAAIELLRSHGALVRTLDVDTWYVLYGDRCLVAPDRADDEFDGLSRRSEDPLAIRGFHRLFERQWEAAAEWVPVRGADDARILRLLAEGLHDHEIAERLGTSERTIRRHVADLMGRSGARTRYQLAVRAFVPTEHARAASASPSTRDRPRTPSARHSDSGLWGS